MPDQHDLTRAPQRASARLWTDPLGRTAVRSLQVLAVIALLVLTVYAATRVMVVVIPVLLAVIFAAALAPIIDRMRRVMPALAATSLTMVGILVAAALVITMIVVAVRSEWDELRASATEGIESLDGFIASLPFDITEEQLAHAREQVISFLTSSGFGSSAAAGVATVGEVITGAVLMLVILFFFLKDGAQIWSFLIRPLQGENHDRGVRVGETSVRVLGGYVRGTAIVALVDTIGIALGMVFLGVPLVLPLATIVFLGAFIPIVGATAAGILACLVALVTQGPVVALMLLGVIIVVNQLEGNFLQPVVMAQSLSLHPLVVLVALTAGTVLAGILGAVLAVPAAAVIWAIIKTWNESGTVSSDTTDADERSARRRARWKERLAALSSRGRRTPASARG